ncbi:hypothetical protein BJX64DRAFT_96311 [Aspergillus heterothallicus]
MGHFLLVLACLPKPQVTGLSYAYPMLRFGSFSVPCVYFSQTLKLRKVKRGQNRNYYSPQRNGLVHLNSLSKRHRATSPLTLPTASLQLRTLCVSIYSNSLQSSFQSDYLLLRISLPTKSDHQIIILLHIIALL